MNEKRNITNFLNPQSPIPLYYQLAEILSEKIRKGEYRPGGRIPSEILLAKTFGIGRPTARMATEALIRKGMLTRRRGAGTFVREQLQEVDLFSLGGTLSAFQKQGVVVTTKIIHAMSLIDVSSSSLSPFAGGPAYFFSRMSYAEEIPVLIEDMYLDPNLFHGIDRFDLTGRSLSQVVEEHFLLQAVGGRQLFHAGYPNPSKAKLLMVSSDMPLLSVRRFLNFPMAENAVYCELFCRTDHFVFSQTIGRE